MAAVGDLNRGQFDDTVPRVRATGIVAERDEPVMAAGPRRCRMV
jgi:hypothetical protein